MARGAAAARHAASARRSCWPARVPGGHLERDGAGRRGQLDARAEHRFPRRERKIDVEIVARHAIERMIGNFDVEVQVAIRAAVDALAALAGHAQLLAVGDAARDARANAMRHAAHAAVGIPFERRQLEVDLGAVEGLLERDAHDCLVVAARQSAGRARRPPARPRRPVSPANRSDRSMSSNPPPWPWPNCVPQSGGGRNSWPSRYVPSWS